MKQWLLLYIMVAYMLPYTANSRILVQIRSDSNQQISSETHPQNLQPPQQETGQKLPENKQISNIKLPDFNMQSIKQKLPDFQIDIPKPDIDYDDLKMRFNYILGVVLEGLVYVGVGAGLGALSPLLILLIVFVLGIIAGAVVAVGLAAFCQSAKVIMKRFFNILKSAGSARKIIVICPYTTLLGIASGLTFYICAKIFEWQINIDFQQIKSCIINSMQIIIGAVTDLGIGTAIGALTPVGLCLCGIGMQFALGSINLCMQSPTSIINIIQLFRKVRKCIKLIPNTAILGGMSGLLYFSLFQ